MKNSLLPVQDGNLSRHIEWLLEDACYEGRESDELRDFRKLLDWEEEFLIVYLSRDGKDRVIQYDNICEVKEVYGSQYCPGVPEVEWSEEPDDVFNSGRVESDNLIIEVGNVLLLDRS